LGFFENSTMTNARRLLCVGAFLGVVGLVSFTHGQGRPTTTPQASTPSYLSTPAQERAREKSQEDSKFAKGGVFTYRPGKEEQLFAVALKPKLEASAVKGRDYLVMVSVSATQAGEGWLASTRIAETLVEMVGDNDRVSLWTIGAPSATKSLITGSDSFLSPKNPEHLKKINAALEKLKQNYPAGDTDLKGGIAKAMATFDGPDSTQRILLFLGDGQSTHNPIDAKDRFALCEEMAAKKVAFFPVPLGVRVHPENLHGLATGTGGVVLRTRVGEELLVDCMKRYFEAFKAPILYQCEATLPATVTFAYPNKLPPLRGDASTLIVGSMKPTDAAEFAVNEKTKLPVNAGGFRIEVKGTPVGTKTPVAVTVAETVQPPEIDHFFLVTLVDQWKNAKDRPALLRGDRTLASAYLQTKLNREELLVSAELALKDLKPDEAIRAFEQAKIMAPHDTEPDAGLRVAKRVKAGQLPPDAMRKIMEKRTVVKLEKGQRFDNAVVQLSLQEDKAPAAVPAPGAQERNDLLQNHRDMRMIQEQKWTEIVENTLRQASRELQQDPDGTLDSLRNILSRVQDNPDLSDRVRTGLANRLSTQLREAKAQATVYKVQKDQISRNLATQRLLIDREQQNRTLEQRQEEQLRNFRSQIEIAYFDERTKVDVMNNLLALQTENRLRGQPWPVAAQADYEMVSAGYNLEKARETRRLSEDRYLTTMHALDRSFVPFPDEPGIEFPKLATWKQVIKQRQGKYEVLYIPDEPKGKAQADSMLKLLEEEIEIPDEFRKPGQPVLMKQVLSYFDERLQNRGSGLPVYIDQPAFKEEASGDPIDLLETTVNFPPYLRKMSIATALRVALSQFPGANATYSVRPGFIEVTTIDRAIMEKVLRVHPVTDLTIPISSAGATQQFGQAGQSQFGVGGIGGGLGQLGGIGGIGGGIGGIGGGIGGIGGGIGGIAGGIGGGIGGLGGSFGGFQPGSTLGGTNASFNGGSFSGGFNGSLGAVGGTAGMQQLIKLITVVVDPGHWYYVQQQNPFQQGINNAFNNQFAGNLGGGLGGGGALGGGLAGALGGGGAGAGAAGPAQTPVEEGGPASLTDPKTNTLYPYIPTLALIVRAQTRTHTSLTGGAIAGRKLGVMAAANDRGAVPLQVAVDNNKKALEIAKANPKGAKNPLLNNPVTVLAAKDGGKVGKGDGKTLPLQFDPKVWDAVLGDGDVPGPLVIATAETLFEQADKKHAVEFLKANLRRGIVVRPWVFEALAIALEATGMGDADEIRRARLSAIALDPKDAEGFLEAARSMADAGQYDRALAFCRQAALIEPNLVFSYDQALVYAERTKDVRGMEWAAGRLVSQDWPIDNHNLHLKAQTRVDSLASSLGKSDADKLRLALQTLKERDVVIHLTWETSQEAADLEMIVKEPTGSVCSYDQKQTAGGGILLANDLKTPNKITYVAAQGFAGTYEITVRKLWGRPLFGQARLEIIQNLGTPKETHRLEIIKLDQTHTVSARLEEGRRSELAAVSPANLKKPAAKDEKTVNGYEQIRRLLYPTTTAGGVRNLAPVPVAVKGSEAIPQARTSVTPKVGAGVNLEVRMSNDQKSMNLVMQPVYQTLKNGRPTSNLSVVPGAK
jgi:tetratricopeptide (TPR) repeat protein